MLLVLGRDDDDDDDEVAVDDAVINVGRAIGLVFVARSVNAVVWAPEGSTRTRIWRELDKARAGIEFDDVERTNGGKLVAYGLLRLIGIEARGAFDGPAIELAPTGAGSLNDTFGESHKSIIGTLSSNSTSPWRILRRTSFR